MKKIVVLIFVDRLLPSGRFHSACGIGGRLKCKQSRTTELCDLTLISQFFGAELVFSPELFALKLQLTLCLLICLQSALVHSLSELISVGRLDLCLVFSFRLFQGSLSCCHFRLACFRLVEPVIGSL